MKVAVVGAGAWGTALGLLAHQNGRQIALWGRNPTHLAEIREQRQNRRHLAKVNIPADWIIEPNLTRATADADAVVVAVPSKGFRESVASLSAYTGILISATKGIEAETGLTMSGILEEVAPRAKVGAISGPSLALEVARGIPTAVVAASGHAATAQQIQAVFHRPRFRVYTSTDLPGVELGGALKNVIAIAAGVCDGCGFGDNSKAALVTRGIAEMRRLGTMCGAQPDTFSGLSGLGDLVVTCFSRLSRNRGFGERLGRGEPLDRILTTLPDLVEGHPTARSAHLLAQRQGVPAPIIGEVFAMLYEGKDVDRAVNDLLNRALKAED